MQSAAGRASRDRVRLARPHGAIFMLTLGAALVLTGCAGDGGAPRGPALVPGDAAQRVVDATPEEVLDYGAVLLRREFGRVAARETGRKLVSAPSEYTTESESDSARDLYRGRSRMRQQAQLVVSPSGSGSVARLRVDIERKDTGRDRAMRPLNPRLSDAPGDETAINSDAALAPSQNITWTRVRRNRTLERRLLDELVDHFALPAAAEAPSAAAALGAAPNAPAETGVSAGAPETGAAQAISPPQPSGNPPPSVDERTLVIPARDLATP